MKLYNNNFCIPSVNRFNDSESFSKTLRNLTGNVLKSEINEDKLTPDRVLKVEFTSYDGATFGKELNSFYPFWNPVSDHDIKKYNKVFEGSKKENIESILIKYTMEKI